MKHWGGCIWQKNIVKGDVYQVVLCGVEGGHQQSLFTQSLVFLISFFNRALQDLSNCPYTQQLLVPPQPFCN